MYTVYIEKHVSGLTMRYGIYDTFEAAAEAYRHVKSVNTVDYVYIEETRYNSGLNKGIEHASNSNS
jgi:hypothetical protein